MTTKLIVLFLGTVIAIPIQSFSQSWPASTSQTSTSGASVLASILAIPSADLRGPQDVLQDYAEGMQSITQQFSARVGQIAAAVNRGELSGEQAEEITAEQYQLAQMQFDVLSASREFLQQDIARAAAAPRPAPDSSAQSEIVVVALPFSSLELNPSIIEYLDLSSAQVESIQEIMSQERRSLVPLMAQMQQTREQLLNATEQGRTSDSKEVRALAGTQARNLTKLIVANSQMRTQIYQLLSPTQQKKLDEFQRQ